MSAISLLLDRASKRSGLPKWAVAAAGAAISLGAFSLLKALVPARKLKGGSGLKVVVTGCDTGFGNITALRLAEKGFIVYAGCLTDAAIQNFQKLAASDPKYKTIKPFKLDVTKDADVKACRAMLDKECPEGLYCLVNNAGVHSAYKWELSTIDMVQRDMDVNYLGVVRTTLALLPLIRKYVATNKARIAAGEVPNPRIVAVTSTAGLMKVSPVGAYCASKHAAQVFGVTLRQEVASMGIYVSLIEPFYARTPLIMSAPDRKIAQVLAQPADVIAAYGGAEDIRKRMSRSAFHTPMPTMLEPEQVVEVMVAQVELWRPNPHNIVGFQGKVMAFATKFLSPAAWDKIVVDFENQGL